MQKVCQMRMRLICFLLGLWPLFLGAQDELPTVNPSAVYTTADGEETTDVSGSTDAPLKAHFFANPENVGAYGARYEWKIWEEGDKENIIVHRFEEELEYTFNKSGAFCIQLYATFVLGNDTISYPGEGEDNPLRVAISESKLEFPNAFTPNGDGYNDVLKAKDGYQSIVKFEAAVFNRWGTKLYSWNRLDGGWDGKMNGKTVRDGVYFLVVNAKGADGRKYNLRKTISVLTGYNKEASGGGDAADE